MRLFPKRVDRGGSLMLWRWLDIPGQDGPYLSRLTLLRVPGLQVMLHWIREPDWSRDPHDHPWPFVALVLRGGYDEERVDLDRSDGYEIDRVTRKRRRFSPIFCDSRTPHRIARVLKNTLTLVVTGGKRKSWGFYRRTGEEIAGAFRLKYIPWKTYFGIEA